MKTLDREELKKLGKRHRRYLLTHTAASWIKAFAFFGIWPFGDGFYMAIFRFVIRSLPFVIGCGIGGILGGLIGHFGFWGLVFGIFCWIESAYEKKLEKLQQQCRQEQQALFDRICLELDLIPMGDVCMMRFEDGVEVSSNGNVISPMMPALERPDVDCRIYNLENCEDANAYCELKREMPWNKTTMEDCFASIDFVRKFGIVIDRDAQRQHLRFFTPSVVVRMIKSLPLSEFCSIRLQNDTFSAKTENVFEMPQLVDLFQWDSLVKRFDETELFCREFHAAAGKVHKNMENIEFLLTA